MVLKTYTKYKGDDEPPRVEDKPKRELSIAEWMQEMADAGFDGEFFVVGNDGRQYKGEIKREDGKMVVKSRRIPTEAEIKATMLKLKNS